MVFLVETNQKECLQHVFFALNSWIIVGSVLNYLPVWSSKMYFWVSMFVHTKQEKIRRSFHLNNSCCSRHVNVWLKTFIALVLNCSVPLLNKCQSSLVKKDKPVLGTWMNPSGPGSFLHHLKSVRGLQTNSAVDWLSGFTPVSWLIGISRESNLVFTL